tara:strand:- start:78 stop:401 length:324 start_codon:yes stop_codon:yes gene_type:complete
MSWKDTIKKKTDTATDSAELWAMNTENIYEGTKYQIGTWYREGKNKEEMMDLLPQFISNIMAWNKGFMDELETENHDGTTDAISEVDWGIVARNFEEDVDEMLGGSV